MSKPWSGQEEQETEEQTRVRGQRRRGCRSFTFVVDVGLEVKGAVAGEVPGEVPSEVPSEVANEVPGEVIHEVVGGRVDQGVVVQPQILQEGDVGGWPPHTLLPKVAHEELEADEGEDAQAENREDHHVRELLH